MRRGAGWLLVLAILLTAITTVMQCYIDYKQSVLLRARTLALAALGLGALGLLSIILYLAAEAGRR